jgi:hypothetical protein
MTESTVDDLKLTRVVLFKVGIGSFQKKGKINLANTKTIKISFKNSVMNDLLKTFSILRLSGDLKVSGVSYEAHQTNRSKILEDSLINLPTNNSLLALIKQLRGISIKLQQFESETIGRVVGIQNFSEAPTGQAIINQEYVMMALEDNSVKSIPIGEITNIEILDPTVSNDFNFFLETIVGQNKEKNKIVTIFFEGKEQSEYMINFLQSVPAWKISYRIFLNDLTTLDKLEFQLQSWAIIDNVLDEDWENVDLTLVTGLPVSFIYDSYSPAWIIRPTIERKTDLGVKVVQFEKEMAPRPRAPSPKSARRAMAKLKKSAVMRSSGMGGPGGGGLAMMAMDEEECEADDEFYAEQPAESAFESSSEAEGGQGLAYKYHIKTPVYVKRNNSSLIPLLQADLGGKIVSIYNKNVNDKHPMISLEFTNTFGTFEEGPISIFIENAFAGEAMLPFMEKNDMKRIPYAVDQGVTVNIKNYSKSDSYHEIEVVDNVYKRWFVVKETTYKIKNIGDTPKRVIIEHSKEHRYKLFDKQKADEETPNFLRFFVDVKGESNSEIVVKERRLDKTSDQAGYISLENLEKWKKLKLIDIDEYNYIKNRINLENKKNYISNDINELVNKISHISNEQSRIRENLRALKQSESEKKLRMKYITKMQDQENKLEEISEAKKKLVKELNGLDEEIHKLVKKWIDGVKEKKEREKNEKKGGK